MDKKRGSIKTFRRSFFVPQCRNVSRRNPAVLCFRKDPVEKKVVHKKGGVSRFSVESFVSHSTEKFRGEHFCITQKLWYRKKLTIRREGVRREYHDLPSKFFCLTVQKIFVGESTSVSLILSM